jgi:hypothetical protein
VNAAGNPMVLDEPVVVVDDPEFTKGLPTNWHPLYQSFVDDGTKCIAEQ